MPIDRYHRQVLLPQIGETGQQKLAQSSVLLVGCGALGSNIAEQLARAGVGKLRIADRDIVELTNLQRQVLFDEKDVQDGLPKAIAAAARLAKVNSSIQVEPKVTDVDGDNIEELIRDVDLVIDGTDNVSTRYLINDAAIKFAKPWIYGACVGMEGRVMAIRPGSGPCLRCIFPTPPAPGELATCDTAGVLGPVAAVVASLQSIAAIKLLSADRTAFKDELITLELWSNRIRMVDLTHTRCSNCPACVQHEFAFLNQVGHDSVTKLCGRNAVQVRSVNGQLSLKEAATRLQMAGAVECLPYMVRCKLTEGGLSLTAFEDGRVIVQGTNDPGRARAVVARFFGN